MDWNLTVKYLLKLSFPYSNEDLSIPINCDQG